jgi:hypothetical protein
MTAMFRRCSINSATTEAQLSAFADALQAVTFHAQPRYEMSRASAQFM